MRTVLFVSSMTLGTETDVRRIHEQFPVKALERAADIERIEAFIGSGFYALQLAFRDGDFQDRFRAFVTMPDVQSFFDQLRPYVDELPSATDQTADLHLATRLLYWEQETHS